MYLPFSITFIFWVIEPTNHVSWLLRLSHAVRHTSSKPYASYRICEKKKKNCMKALFQMVFIFSCKTIPNCLISYSNTSNKCQPRMTKSSMCKSLWLMLKKLHSFSNSQNDIILLICTYLVFFSIQNTTLWFENSETNMKAISFMVLLMIIWQQCTALSFILYFVS